MFPFVTSMLILLPAVTKLLLPELSSSPITTSPPLALIFVSLPEFERPFMLMPDAELSSSKISLDAFTLPEVAILIPSLPVFTIPVFPPLLVTSPITFMPSTPLFVMFTLPLP